mmetsp:Transcript_55407/g.159319  ORF Transcript_55407/g.159319 Transcript_55407/m.159319 type:complete len:207 (+) Transcript_55407:1605-2225(+)
MLQCPCDHRFPHPVAAQRRRDTSRDMLAPIDALQVNILMLLDLLRVVHPAHLLGAELRSQDIALALALRRVPRGDLTQLRGRGLDFCDLLFLFLIQVVGQLRQVQALGALYIVCNTFLCRRGEAFHLGLTGDGLYLQCLDVLCTLLDDAAGELGELQRVIRACRRMLLRKGHEVALPSRRLLNRMLPLDSTRMPISKPLPNGLQCL